MTEPVRVYRSCVVDAPIEDVWGLVNSFNGLSLWHDGVKESRIEDEKGDNTIGGVRNLSLKETTESVRITFGI